MTVRQIEGEVGRFYVQSRSRPEVVHLVDLAYVDEQKRHHPQCSCEHCYFRGDFACVHIAAAVESERQRLHL